VQPTVAVLVSSTGKNPNRDHEAMRSIRELPLVAHSLVEGAGHHIERVFLDGAVEKFIRCPMA
jgi:hypothetical protein